MNNITLDTVYDAKRKIWSGPSRKNFYGSNMSIGEVTLFNLSLNPNKIIQIDDASNTALTAAELLHNARTIAIALIGRGLTKGDVVGLLSGNVPHLSAVVLATWLCGAAINPLHADYEKDSINLIFKVTQPKIIFCQVPNYQNLQSACKDVDASAQIFTMDGQLANVGSVEQLLHENLHANLNTFSYPCYELNADDTAIISCTSGTTDTPKGVTGSHRSLLDLNRFCSCHMEPSSVLLSLSSLCWISGTWAMLAMFKYGLTVIISSRPFTPEYLCQLAEKYAVTHITTGTSHANAFVKNTPPAASARLKSVKYFFTGGSKVPSITIEKMQQILSGQFVVCYGMTELMNLIALNYHTQLKPNSVGKLNPNLAIRVVNKAGQLAAVNEIGILHIKNPFKWQGYYKKPEATDKVISPDGWLISNDMVYFDEQGFLYVCSRENNVFKSNNFHIYPEIIEEVLFRMSNIADVCVFGVPDFTAGYLTACAIVRKNKAIQLTADMVEEFVAKSLNSAYHLRGGVYFVDALPKTISGKIRRCKILSLIKELGMLTI